MGKPRCLGACGIRVTLGRDAEDPAGQPMIAGPMMSVCGENFLNGVVKPLHFLASVWVHCGNP